MKVDPRRAASAGPPLRRVFLPVVLLLAPGWPLLCRGAEESPAELLARMSSVYAGMRSSYLMRATIWKQVSSGSAMRESRRQYRLIQRDGAIRLDFVGTEHPIIRMRRPNGNFLLYVSSLRQFCEQPPADPDAERIAEVLEAFRITLHARFADLAATQPVIASAKPARITVGGQRKNCLKIDLKSPPASPRQWSGTLWIDRDSALVWRAAMSTRSEMNEIIQEEVTWQEILSGEAVPAGELDWTPPAGAQRIAQFPFSVPDDLRRYPRQ